jgi:uncharacterized membrane protein YoaK (UPF0700 family)
MLVRQGSARTDSVDRRLACALAAIAGAINCTAFQAVGFFAANMTGNVSMGSNRIALLEFSPALFYLAVIGVFVTGALLSTLLISSGLRREVRTIYATSILIESALMALLGLVEVASPIQHPTSVLVLGSSFLMGWQNAVVTRISGARVRTTHVSGMITDIGIELALLFDSVAGRKIPDDASANESKLKLHCATVLSFFAGGVAGVVVYQAVHAVLFLIAAVLLLAMSITALLRTRTAAASLPVEPK